MSDIGGICSLMEMDISHFVFIFDTMSGSKSGSDFFSRCQ